MSDPRWTDETEALVRRVDGLHRIDFKMAGAICGCHHWTLPVPYNAVDAHAAHERHRATELLAALADAGLLVQPGGETRTEWSAEPSLTPRYVTGPIESDREIVCPMREPEQAMRDYLRGMRGRPVLVRRTVYTGPWQPATQEAPHGA